MVESSGGVAFLWQAYYGEPGECTASLWGAYGRPMVSLWRSMVVTGRDGSRHVPGQAFAPRGPLVRVRETRPGPASAERGERPAGTAS